jgi:hypothetical protein
MEMFLPIVLVCAVGIFIYIYTPYEEDSHVLSSDTDA